MSQLSVVRENQAAIHLRAYELWQARGCPQGSAWEDWHTAEQQIAQEHKPPTEQAKTARKRCRSRSLRVRTASSASSQLLAALVPQSRGATGS